MISNKLTHIHCSISLNVFKAIVMFIQGQYSVLHQRMYTENCVIHAFRNCQFKWYVLCLILSNVKHYKLTIRIQFKYDSKYAILLDKFRNGEDCICFEFGYIIFKWTGKPPLPLKIFASDMPYILMFYFALLYISLHNYRTFI